MVLVFTVLRASVALPRSLFPDMSDFPVAKATMLVDRCPVVVLNETCAWAELLKNRPIMAWLCSAGSPPIVWLAIRVSLVVALRTRKVLVWSRLAASNRRCTRFFV